MVENRVLHVIAQSPAMALSTVIQFIAAGRSNPRDVGRKSVLHRNEKRGRQKRGRGSPPAATHGCTPMLRHVDTVTRFFISVARVACDTPVEVMRNRALAFPLASGQTVIGAG